MKMPFKCKIPDTDDARIAVQSCLIDNAGYVWNSSLKKGRWTDVTFNHVYYSKNGVLTHGTCEDYFLNKQLKEISYSELLGIGDDISVNNILLCNLAINVEDPKDCRTAQEYFFNLGIEWCGGGQQESRPNYLFYNTNHGKGFLTRSLYKETFDRKKEQGFKVVTIHDIDDAF